MKLIRFYHQKIEQYGWVLNDQVGIIDGDPFGEFIRREATISLSSVTLSAPVRPSKIICVGRNYLDHARERQVEVPSIPLIFLKPPSSIIGPDQPICLPPQSARVEHEAELVVVIGKRGKSISISDAFDFIFGYTVGNDVTARDLQSVDGQWTRAKGFDTFCPIGPWIETEFDPTDAMINCYVNGQMRQMASTRDMIFSIGQIVSFISSIMTLNPGDIIFTGTPAGVGELTDGDKIEINIAGIGQLCNHVIKEAT
jgi:2-keto-4-pentenoate hydratase/2-oxohepta-3-ene-1,7-dioic acid hydratase in catechol pathway